MMMFMMDLLKHQQKSMQKVVEHSDLAKRTHESFVKARAEIGAWMKLSDGAYLKQRNRALGV